MIVRAIGDGSHPRVRESRRDFRDFPFHLLKKRRLAPLWGLSHIGRMDSLADAIVERIAPIQAHRRDLEARPSVIDDVLANGKTRASKRAQQTLDEVQQAMGLA